ncbi:MAG: PQQ-binding-like beta-propeller repeat protein [Planctomycetaceae bacterium]|nr:PQQ-binding-like beta-propeller repeat protein [Planctomycetaceae bacterium]
MFRHQSRQKSLALALCGLPLLAAASAWAGDWPQILGPQRSGKATGEKLAAAWPASGPKHLWSHQLGSGYAGPAVVGERVIVFHRVGDSEIVEAVNAKTGQPLWKAGFAATYRRGVDPDEGPRCVPLVADEKVFVFGAAGDLRCVSLAAGEKIWERSLYADYSADEGYFGAGSTPILVAGKLLVNVGGRGAGIVALDPASGKTVWKGSDEDASYSSPAAVSVGGKEQALFITRYNCVLADPSSGVVQKLFPFGERGPTVNAATPLVSGGKLFVTASYGVGARYAALDAAPNAATSAALNSATAKTIWGDDDTLSSQYATPVLHNGFLYGTHGREDVGVAQLRCVEAATGKVRWNQEGYGVANVILAEDMLLIVGARGRLALAKASSAKYEELASCELVQGVSRALPALSGGRLYVRTGSGKQGGKLHCLGVSD